MQGLAVKILAGLVAIGLAFMGGFGAGKSWSDDRWEAKAAKQALDARATEDDLRKTLEGQRETSDAKLEEANVRLRDALERLLKRPERLSDAARAACKGTTGAELSGRDAAAFERLAARAQRVQVELERCLQDYDASKAKIDAFNKGR